MTIVARVAARHLFAAFIPDSFFKGYEAEFKRLAAEPLTYGLPTAIFLIEHDVIPLLTKFGKELIDLAPVSRPAVEELVRACLKGVKVVRDAHYESATAVDYRWPKTPLERVMGHIGTFVNQKVSKDIKTLGKALKTPITIHPAKVEALAARALKQASPEELAAVEQYSSGIADAFYEKHVDGSIPRLIKKDRTDIDLVKWVATVRKTLANYATGKGGRLLEFDLSGMKVVIDDWSVGPDDHDKYVKYLDAAHQLLKRKQLGRAWYGTTFIQCEQCGGAAGAHGDVGGTYTFWEDSIRIHSRPTAFITELMVHEIGHRYWFKDMSQSQRAKFEGLVLIREGKRPGGERKLLDPDTLDSARDNVMDHRRAAINVIDKCESELTSGKSSAEEIRRRVAGEQYDIEALSNFSLDPTDDLDSHGKALFKSVEQAVKAATTVMTRAPEASNVDDPAVHEAWKDWFAACRDAVKDAAAAALACMQYAFKSYEERERASRTPEQVAWDEDPRAVLPVSDYGATHIDEAFAEAFMFYVMGTKMNADQEASFRAVLLDRDRLASRVANRWLDGPTVRAPRILAAASR